MSTATTWKSGPATCANCNCDIRTINPIYTVRNITDKAWCSRECRSTVTKEEVSAPPKKPVVSKEVSAPPKKPVVSEGLQTSPHVCAPAAKAPAAKAPAAKEPKASAAPKAPRKPNSENVWMNPKGRFKILPHNKKLQGNRGQIFSLIKNNMTVPEAQAVVAKAGLEYNGNMRVLVSHYNCLEVIVK